VAVVRVWVTQLPIHGRDSKKGIMIRKQMRRKKHHVKGREDRGEGRKVASQGERIHSRPDSLGSEGENGGELINDQS
jgi:hypothetical protein